MASATISSSCSSFFNFKGNNKNNYHGCRKLDGGVAMWILNGFTSAFFASLESCSCIRIKTEDDGDEYNDLPLIFNDGNSCRDSISSSDNQRRMGKGKNKM
ncbi:hypothetical protein Leryth_012908 [Lithospermum erythrorhizon]|nr:hypothetical protein Leryth_012908 [Lithospermum erythrorhizon]